MLSDKKLSKITKLLGKTCIVDMDVMSDQDLKNLIAQAEGSIKSAGDELEANERYREMKECLKDLTASYGEVKKRQKAKIEYCLHMLEEQGKQ